MQPRPPGVPRAGGAEHRSCRLEELVGRIYTPCVHRRPPAAPISPTPCCWSSSTSTAATMTMSCRPGWISQTWPPGWSDGFRFDRAGIRIATPIDPQTVITGDYCKTSLIATLRERWNLGPPLTARTRPRPASRPVPELAGTLVPLDKPLPTLDQYLLGVAVALDTKYTGHVPGIDHETGQQANEYIPRGPLKSTPASSHIPRVTSHSLDLIGRGSDCGGRSGLLSVPPW